MRLKLVPAVEGLIAKLALTYRVPQELRALRIQEKHQSLGPILRTVEAAGGFGGIPTVLEKMTQMVPLEVGEAVEVQLNVQSEPRPVGLLQVTEPGTTVDKLVAVDLLEQMGTSPVVVEVLLRLDSPQITIPEHLSLGTEVQANPFLGFLLRQQRLSPSEKSVAAMFILPVVAVVDFMTQTRVVLEMVA